MTSYADGEPSPRYSPVAFVNAAPDNTPPINAPPFCAATAPVSAALAEAASPTATAADGTSANSVFPIAPLGSLAAAMRTNAAAVSPRLVHGDAGDDRECQYTAPPAITSPPSP